VALTGTLQTRVGRRIVLLFVVSALLPVVALAVVGYVQVRRQLLAQAHAQLARAARDVGMGVVEQLRADRALVREAIAAFRAGGERALAPGGGIGARGRSAFATFAVAGPRGTVVLWGEPAGLTLDARQSAAVDGGRAALVVGSGDPPTVWMVESLGAGGRAWVAIAADHVFRGAQERAMTEAGEAVLCIRAAGQGRRLFCPADAASAEPLIAERWEVFLAYDYAIEPWQVEVAQPISAILAPVSGFRRTFLATLAGVLGLVVLLSSIQVRRSLRPLMELRRGTERLARRDFSVPVEVRSRDEFEELAQSFNGMAGELSQRIGELNQLSYGALVALARTVDANSSWTAGHSERVTALSLRIADHVGLEPALVEALQRGGLLHDIGKIGTPAFIIDKPGPLDPAELAIVRRHPEVGARILSPIEAFAAAIPVVLHHHEKYDGTGYPHRLRGEGIPYLARLLAVADVYDALVSERPYRRSWSHPEAVAMIREGAGSHFDPALVAVFLKVMDAEGDAARFAVTIEDLQTAARVVEARG